MPFTNDPDYLNSPDDNLTPQCRSCGDIIQDTTTAKQAYYGREWYCSACVAQDTAENVPQDWTERELVKVNYTPRKLNWSW
jgi:hypothetical protein